jgi:hypothetical protein
VRDLFKRRSGLRPGARIDRLTTFRSIAGLWTCSAFRFRNAQHGVQGRRRIDRKGRMVMRLNDLEIASQSEIPLPISAFSFCYEDLRSRALVPVDESNVGSSVGAGYSIAWTM